MYILINKSILGLVPGDTIKVSGKEMMYEDHSHCVDSREGITFRNEIDTSLLLEYGEEVHEDGSKLSENPYLTDYPKTIDYLIDLLEKIIEDRADLGIHLNNSLGTYFAFTENRVTIQSRVYNHDVTIPRSSFREYIETNWKYGRNGHHPSHPWNFELPERYYVTKEGIPSFISIY